MRTVFVVAAFWLAFGSPAHSATIEQDIAEVERLNDLCRGGSGDNPATARYCKKRDAAYSALTKRGWCFGHDGQAGYERQWEECQMPPSAKTPEPKPYSATFLAMNKDLMLRAQRQQCQDMGIAAGNPKGAAQCTERLERAYAFMHRMAYSVAIPMPAWQTCAEKAFYDIDLGARCIAAAKEICKADENGTAMDYGQCLRIMTSGAWIANPSARALRF